jgi:hypothetical protein
MHITKPLSIAAPSFELIQPMYIAKPMSIAGPVYLAAPSFEIPLSLSHSLSLPAVSK